MGGRIFYRFRQIAPDRGLIFTLAVFFVLLEGGTRYLEHKNIAIAVNLPFRPGYGLLFMAGVLHGIIRVFAIHPIWNGGYQGWLESTPWSRRKALPMGPVELVWEDGLILGPLILLSAVLPEPGALHLLCAFLLNHLLALTATLFLTRTWAIGYAVAFALGLAVWLWRQPLACLVVSILVYLMAYEGLRRGFNRFPWKRFELPNADTDLISRGGPSEMWGWPYDRMLRDVVGDHGISRIDAVLCCMLVGWWLFVLSSFFGDPWDRHGVLFCPFFAALAICPLLRLWVYIKGYVPPTTFWARIITGRWIIPGYDQVFVAPICTFLVGPLFLVLFRRWSVLLEVSLPIATAAMLLVALITPPRLKRWRLTGRHRIVHALSLTNSQPTAKFVRIG